MRFSEFSFPFTFETHKKRSLLASYQSQLLADGHVQPITDSNFMMLLSAGELGIVSANQLSDNEVPYYAINRAIYHTIDFAYQTAMAPFYHLLDMFTPGAPYATQLFNAFLPGNVPENELFVNYPQHVALCPNDHAYFVGMAGSGSSCRCMFSPEF